MAGESSDVSVPPVVSITASAVANSDFHDSVLAGSLMMGMTFVTVNTGFQTREKTGRTLFLGKLLVFGIGSSLSIDDMTSPDEGLSDRESNETSCAGNKRISIKPQPGSW